MPTPSTKRDRIKTWGLELEGGWLSQSLGKHNTALHQDGSVRGLSSDCSHVGEIASPVISSMTAARQWLIRHYPDSVNDSCGFHVHIGVSLLNYSRLMDEDFHRFWLKEMNEFYEENKTERGFELFKSRLDGKNIYCQRKFRPEEQLNRTEAYGPRRTHPRYSQLNFCWARHGTMECRVFPCFPKAESAVKALEAFTNCVNTFLARAEPEEPLRTVVHVREFDKPTRVSSAHSPA
jgi:hypothetical protein